ncbi:MAG: hypothetical protein EP330_13935 [Deltaproteobacteria bacterium]|nr:MAG: hypothetical protein EP330_13935 [Deltaproteobacteria bacterium]
MIPSLVIGLGLAVICSGLVWPDHMSFNSSTGSYQRSGDTAPIVGGVFTTLGLVMFAFAAYVEVTHWWKQRAG